MSMGYGECAKLIAEDNATLLYEYSGYNLNKENMEKYKFDGFITIDKFCLVEAEKRRKIKKTPSGKKEVIKKVLTPVSADDLVAARKITVENCSNCWMKRGLLDTDVVALCLIDICLTEYQMNEEISEIVTLHC